MAIPYSARTVRVGYDRYLGRDALSAERDTAINGAMKALFFEGCRRIRVIQKPNTGDYTDYIAMGWVD